VDINWIIDSPFELLPEGDPDADALSIDGEPALTYRDLRALRDKWCAELLAAGVVAGDRVGLLLLNSHDYVGAYFAIARLQAFAVRLNFRLTGPELQYIINDSGCSVVLFHTSRASQLEPIINDVPVKLWISIDDDESVTPSWARPETDTAAVAGVDIAGLPRPAGTDPLMLMYTSGTTGQPKGVVWTHDNALWLALIQASKWSYTRSTVSLTTGPLYHAGAFEDLLLPALFVHGKAVAMSSGGLTTRRIVDAIRNARATHVLLYPFLLYDLLRDPTVRDDELASVERFLTGGDPVLPWAIQAIDERFPGVELQQAYGLTEGGTMSTLLEHADRLTHPDSVGRPMPLTQVRTVRDDSTPAEPGEAAEVWVRAPNVTAGYWNNPSATSETFVDGWCRTGDLGRITSDGFLVLAGRKKDMIRSGGENVYPIEVEVALSTHPAVSGIAVVGVPDSDFLEVGCAVIVLAEDWRDADGVELRSKLRAYAREHLAGYKCPRHYVFVPELPINGAGKVQKHVLRQTYAELGRRE
jgi:fatty-acyl-CoA synthase